MPEVLVLADDLSGACEAAAAFLLRTTRITVQLSESLPDTGDGPARVLARDLDSRRDDAAAAAAGLGAAIDAAPRASRVLVKVDSLLRGHLDALVRCARRGEGDLVVVCPASPGVGRTLLGGVVHVDGTPLHRTDHWRAETAAAPASVAEALPGSRTVPVDLGTVRGSREELASTLAAAAAAGQVPIVDAETEADLDAVVEGALAVTAGRVVLVGAGGMAAAVARSLRADAQPTPPADAGPSSPSVATQDRSVLVVVGSAAPLLRTEVAELDQVLGAVVTDLAPTALLDGPAVRVPEPQADARVVVVRLDPTAPIDPSRGEELATALADAVVPVTEGRALVLTGGETARAVLDRLGVRSLHPVHHDRGAVTARTDDGRTVVTRPGSFGTGASLAELVTTLTDRTTKEPS